MPNIYGNIGNRVSVDSNNGKIDGAFGTKKGIGGYLPQRYDWAGHLLMNLSLLETYKNHTNYDKSFYPKHIEVSYYIKYK